MEKQSYLTEAILQWLKGKVFGALITKIIVNIDRD